MEAFESPSKIHVNTIRKAIRGRKAWEQMRDRVFELRMDRIFKAGPHASASYIPQPTAQRICPGIGASGWPRSSEEANL